MEEYSSIIFILACEKLHKLSQTPGPCEKSLIFFYVLTYTPANANDLLK